jgi:E3 ubiquitin-protein ligase synoviolin
MASLINSKAKYVLSALEFHRAASRGGENAPPWEDKSMWIFYVDLITGWWCPPDLFKWTLTHY